MLTDVITRLLLTDPTQRMKRSDFFKQLQPNVQNIMNLQPFNLLALTNTTVTTISQPVRRSEQVRVSHPPPPLSQPVMTVHQQSPPMPVVQHVPAQKVVMESPGINKSHHKVTFSPNKSVNFTRSPPKYIPMVPSPNKPLQSVSF